MHALSPGEATLTLTRCGSRRLCSSRRGWKRSSHTLSAGCNAFQRIERLAGATLQEVLGVWEGLGYYGRARNLHKAAQLVMQEYNGQLPDEARLLRKLPGIGRYTAGAIASIAFGQR